MDIHSARARLQLMAELRDSGALAKLIFADEPDNWRLHPVQIGPGWIDLIAQMLDEILALPDHDKIGIKFIRSCDGDLDLGWFGESQGHAADRICIAARARAAHVCEWCGARGRHEKQHLRVLCRTHSELVRTKPIEEIGFEERLAPGVPFPQRRVLIKLIIGKRTESGLTAALHTELGEQGFELDHIHHPISWLTATAHEANIYMLDIERAALTVDLALFTLTGEKRSFVLHAAEPIIMRAADALQMGGEEIADLIARADDYDPEIRVHAFNRLLRVFASDEAPP